ncbi:MAG: hypothetical protein EBV00_06085 [Burkholderiaceae bacterium]|nr:hypothetical protein [Burkholderiaceae bacterium]
MKSFTNTLFVISVGLLVILFHANAVFAQTNYPNKPIMFIVPYGAGGGADARSRQIAQKMSALLKQPIVVENKPGAGGNIGTEMIARAATSWFGILVPANTPPDLVRLINTEAVRAINSPAVREKYAAMGAEPVGNTPEQFANFIKSEIAKWTRVVKESGAKVD